MTEQTRRLSLVGSRRLESGEWKRGSRLTPVGHEPTGAAKTGRRNIDR
ncbi:hypothetical protein GF420_00090 [candidate division GN15 bacterium]|nr:hypothetical protein [candidate division GN15 bacterium]